MAGPPMGEGPSNGNGKDHDDLTRIEGIGETKAQWLKSIGITTIEDLACASAGYLESQLREQGHITGRNEIEQKWIAQAQALVDEISSQQATESLAVSAEASSPQQATEPLAIGAEMSFNSPAKKSEPPQSPETASAPEAEEAEIAAVSEATVAVSLVAATAAPEAEAETFISPETKRVEWSTFAAFAVEFQDRRIEDRTEQRTIVRHVETDRFQSWPSLEGESLKRWILGQVAQARPSELVTKQLAAAPPVIVQMGQLHLLQPPRTAMPAFITQAGRILSNSVRSEEPFALEVSFELIGDALADIAEKQVTYCVQWDAKNLAPPHEIISLGDTEPTFVLEGQTSYTTLLPEVILHSGIYRLQMLIILRGIAALPTFFDALVLQVV